MPSGMAKKFCLICGRARIDGLLVAVNGDFHAYVNLCRHMETPLDWVQDRFFSDDGRYLCCGTHGALYELRTGRCVEGPCKGLSLFPLPVEVIDGDVMVKCPEGDLTHLTN